MFTGEYQPKNSTTARKPGNDMKKNASIAKMGDSPAAWQKADKALGFNGQDNGSSQRPSTNGRYAGNQHSGFSNPDSIQMRQRPNLKGNHADQATKTMGGAPATAGASKNPVESGRRSWMPSAGQNYKGNASMIQEKQMPNRRGNDGC